MNSSAPFDSPKRLLKRVAKQISNFVEIENAYFEEKPWNIVNEKNADLGFITYKLKFTRTLPDELENIGFEISVNLRATLDQVGYESAVLGGNKNPKSAYFPIAPDLAKLDNNVIARGKCKDLPGTILALFRSFAPYRSGNIYIWAVNEFANSGKHRLLAPAVIEVIQSKNKILGGGGTFMSEPHVWDRNTNEIPIFSCAPEAKIEFERIMSIAVCIEKVEELRSIAAKIVFEKIYLQVRDVLEKTEEECRRLGLV